MEECLEATAEGRSRKEREAARREEELAAALRAEYARLAKEQQVADKAAANAAEASCPGEPQQEPEQYNISVPTHESKHRPRHPSSRWRKQK